MCRTFSVRHTETIEQIETYQMCCTFILVYTAILPVAYILVIISPALPLNLFNTVLTIYHTIFNSRSYPINMPKIQKDN